MVKEGILITWLTIVGTGCWGICFWWMHRISSAQNRLLKQLAQQAERIEQLSSAEHDLIREVHPQVAEIKEGVEDVREAVTAKS
jgi:cell division protein FtsB